MSQLKLTKSQVDKIPFTVGGQRIYMDRDIPGFGLRVGRQVKCYFVQRHIGRKNIRVTIGRHGIFTAEEARREARELLVRMTRGENPNEAKRRARVYTITLGEALDEYLLIRKELRPFTVKTYRHVISYYLEDWVDKPLADITANMVIQMHFRIGTAVSGDTANNVMRVLRAIYNLAILVHEDMPSNPVLRLTQTRAWYRQVRRQSVVKLHELPAWYSAVMDLENDLARDYLRLILFTGMRRSEALRLRWRDVDLKERTLFVPDTKNHEPLMLPLSEFLMQLFQVRYQASGDSEFVFPGDGATGHAIEPKKFIGHVREASGVEFTLHDLRRTFITVAESLDISTYALKRLLNHKDSRDVTAGYIVLTAERLRQPMDKISRFLLSACQPKEAPAHLSSFDPGLRDVHQASAIPTFTSSLPPKADIKRYN